MGLAPRITINGQDRVTNAAMPTVWNDAQAPAFAQGAGAAAPALVDVIPAASTGGMVRLLNFTGAGLDRSHWTIQIPHDLHIPSTGETVTLRPHVHWTFRHAPSTGETVVWGLSYVYAKGNTAFVGSAAFSTVASTTRTAAYVASSGAEQYRHHISPFASGVSVSASNLGASMFVIGTLYMSSAATSTGVCLLGMDWHYQKQPTGTVNEYTGY